MNLSSELAKISAAMQSLAAKSANKEPDISKDISDLRSHIVSIQSRVDISLDAMSRSLGVLHSRIELIASKMVTSESLEISHKALMEQFKMRQLEPSLQPWTEEDQEWLNSFMNIPELGTIPDITCSETILRRSPPFIDLTFEFNGTMDHPEQVSLAQPMKCTQKRM